MARGTRAPLKTPPWIIGPGLLVPPVFLPLILCVYPREVAPQMPVPYLDNYEASRHLEFVAARTRAPELTSSEGSLRASWLRLQRVASTMSANDERAKQGLAAAQHQMLKACERIANEGGVRPVWEVGEGVAWNLAEATSSLERDGHEAAAKVRRFGGTFLKRARQVGLVDSVGRLRAHPIVPFVLTQMSWRVACGLPIEGGLTPVELDAVDVFRIRFGQALPAEARLKSVERFSRRHREFPGEIAASVLFLDAGEPDQAASLLRQASAENPKNRAIRNHLIFAEAELY